jgi:hypothetical protein
LEFGDRERTVFVADAKAFALAVYAVMLHGNRKAIPPWNRRHAMVKKREKKGVSSIQVKS